MGFIDFVGIAAAVLIANITREILVAIYVTRMAERARFRQIAQLQDYARKLDTQVAAELSAKQAVAKKKKKGPAE